MDEILEKRNSTGAKSLVGRTVRGVRRIARLWRRLLEARRRPEEPDGSTEGLTISYVPAFREPEDFIDRYARLLWYLHPLADHIKEILIPAVIDELPEIDLPGYLDPHLLQFRERIHPKIRLFPHDRADLWRKVVEESHVVMQWREGLQAADPEIERLQKRAVSKVKTWRVDPRSVRHEGSFYLHMSSQANPSRAADLAESSRRFQELAEDLEGRSTGYLFGTGPSLARSIEFDFSDGITIACNSMVRNLALLRHIQPSVIAVADPIFHAGCSSYAGEFRKYLLAALEEFDPYLVVPFRDYKLYLENLPPRATRKMVGIPLEKMDRVNLDLLRDFRVRSVANVLTLLLLPLGATLFDELVILGCDGRPLEEDGYFWKHDPSSQFGEHMDDIRRCHPAFFEIAYNDYYLEHIRNLDEWISAVEREGTAVRNLTPSYIPALQKRTDPNPRERRAKIPDPLQPVV